MSIPAKKLANGFELPIYGLGLWQMGGRWETDDSRDEVELSAIRAALELGVTHFDTAESYGEGHAEELLGEAIKDIDRASLTIASKVSKHNQSYDGIRRSFDASLKRLNTDYVDLYMLHRYPSMGLPITEAMRAMDELVDEGLVKHVGVSNLSPARFIEAQAHSKHKLVCNQVHYNVQYREAELRGVLKQCQVEDVMLVAWRPLQKGGLSDAPLLIELAKKYEKTPYQIALNWLMAQDHVVTICKTSDVRHLKENLGAIGWSLEANDVERIRRDFPDQRAVSDAVPLDYEADIAPW